MSGVSISTFGTLNRKKVCSYYQGLLVLESLGYSEPWPDGWLVPIPHWLSVSIETDSPVVDARWAKKIADDYCRLGDWRADHSSLEALADRCYINAKVLRRIVHDEQIAISLSVADRLWVATGNAGPLPEESWLRDAEGNKVTDYRRQGQRRKNSPQAA